MKKNRALEGMQAKVRRLEPDLPQRKSRLSSPLGMLEDTGNVQSLIPREWGWLRLARPTCSRSERGLGAVG